MFLKVALQFSMARLTIVGRKVRSQFVDLVCGYHHNDS
jgi:hypothetical protein